LIETKRVQNATARIKTNVWLLCLASMAHLLVR